MQNREYKKNNTPGWVQYGPGYNASQTYQLYCAKCIHNGGKNWWGNKVKCGAVGKKVKLNFTCCMKMEYTFSAMDDCLRPRNAHRPLDKD